MTDITITDDRTTFDFFDAPSFPEEPHGSVGFGGNITRMDEQTFNLYWTDGINQWDNQFPTWHAAHAYLGHLIDFAFRGQYFEETADDWLLRNWFTSLMDWARWHYRYLLADLEQRGLTADLEDMGGGSIAVRVVYGPNRFAWIDDMEAVNSDGYRCYLYEAPSDGGFINQYSEGGFVSYEKALEMAEQWDERYAERLAVGAVLAQVEQFDLAGRQRVLVEALHEVNVQRREV